MPDEPQTNVAKPTEETPQAQPEQARVESPKSFTEEQWNQREQELEQRLRDSLAGKDGTIQKMSDELATLRKTKLDSELDEFMRKLEDKGVDSNIARELADLRRDYLTRHGELNDRELSLKKQMEAQEEVARTLKAEQLAKEYGVDSSKLRTCKTVVEMENTALKEAIKKAKLGQTTPDKVDAPKGTPQGRDLTGLSPEERLEIYFREKEAEK